jgi:hypothetical protein
VDFTYADSPVATAYEPITRSNSDTGLWIDSFLDAVGFNTPDWYVTDLQAYNHSRRIAENTNWAYTIFVVNSAADADGSFANIVSGFARIGGPYLVMTYDLGGRGIDYMGNVTAHESAHVFCALDERSDGSPYTYHSGYYNTQNLNSADGNPNPSLQVPSIMAGVPLRDQAYATHTSSPTSLAMMGWQDSDGDGVFDLLDVPLSLVGNGNLNPATRGYDFSGSSQVQTLTNVNPYGLGNDITLNLVSQAQYRLDGKGPWLTAATYGAPTATLSLKIGPLPSGKHSIAIRTIDDESGVASNVLYDSFAVENRAPALNTSLSPKLNAIFEDAVYPASTLVSSLLVGAVSDQDPGALRGTAVTAAPTTNGHWQYAIGGTPWLTMAPSESSALLLPAWARVRFLPKVDYNGVEQLVYRAWDQTEGTSGGTFNLSGHVGGTTAFSAFKDSASLTVTPVNDKPALSLSGSAAYQHNQAAILLAPGANVTDVDSANFAGGRLRVRVQTGASASNVLAIGGSFILDANNNVKLGSAIIGQLNAGGGHGTTDLYITLKASVTPSVAQQLIRSITFRSVGGSAGKRIVLFSLTDGDGGPSADATRTVNVN